MQSKATSSAFLACTERKLWPFKILDIYALVHYTFDLPTWKLDTVLADKDTAHLCTITMLYDRYSTGGAFDLPTQSTISEDTSSTSSVVTRIIAVR